MVQFNEKSFTIEVNTGGNPIEDWMGTIAELILLVKSLDIEGLDESPWHTMNLLSEMLPDVKTAQALYPHK